MSIEVTFIRHGETVANAGSVWQGQGDAELSETGRAQALALQKRLAATDFDVVISSDLVRTLQTAELADLDPIADPQWREMDIGAWEGLTRTEVRQRFPEQLKQMAEGDRTVRMGGAESWNQFSARIDAAVDSLFERVAPGGRVLVMAHGGVIHSALATRLGFGRGRPWPIARILNTAVTELIIEPERAHLQVLNDVRHAPIVTGHEEDRGNPIALIRHGETVANVEGRWHGRTDGPLTELGLRQGAHLAAGYGGITRVFASPLERTRLTAGAFSAVHGLDVEIEDDLIEIDFGAWEGRTTSELQERFAQEWHRVFDQGLDEPRGGTGETFEQAGERVATAVRRLAERHPTDRLALFTHGGAIWSFALRILGIEWTGWRKLSVPSNTSVTHVRFDGGLPVLIDYNLPA
jgi:broad specificity phosphatase PhoE